MKQLLHIVALLLLLSSCNNGNYNSNPNNNGQTPNNNVNCPVAIADTVCSCTDSFSWYMNGTVYSAVASAGHGLDNAQAIQINGEIPGDREVDIIIGNYTGTGTYNLVSAQSNGLAYIDENLDSYVTGTSCTGGTLVITEDNGTTVKGKFYGVVINPVNNQYKAIKGGQFTAHWYN